MNNIFFFLSIFIVSNIYGQENTITQININYGKSFTSFIHEDNDEAHSGINIDYTSGNTYSLDLGITLGEKHRLRPEVRYQEYGAISELNNTPLSWKLNYIGTGLGYCYSVLKTDALSISPGIVLNINYMVSGEQNIGTERFNIKEDELLKPIDVVTSIALNSRFKVTEYLFINFDYRFGISLTEIENESGDKNEQTRNLGHIASIGLSFNL